MAGTGFFEGTSPGIVAPESIGPLILEPLQASSVALRVSNLVTCGTKDYRFPILEANPLAHWVGEGDPLTEEDPTVGELVVTPRNSPPWSKSAEKWRLTRSTRARRKSSAKES